MKIKKGDKVKVITGKDKGKEGAVVRVFPKLGRVIVEKVNVLKKHVKPGAVSKEGGIVSIEKSISVSNVMLVNSKTKLPEKIGFKDEKGKKVRYFKKTGNTVN